MKKIFPFGNKTDKQGFCVCSDNESGWKGHVDEELTDLGSKVGEFASRLTGVETQVEAMSATLGGRIGELTKAFNVYVTSQRDSAKTPWGVLIAAFTLVVLVIGLITGGIMSGYIRDLTRIEDYTGRVDHKIQAHEKLAGHLPMEHMFDSIDKRLESLNESSLTRHRTSVDLVNRIDVKIQQELKDNDMRLDARIDGIKEEMRLRHKFLESRE